MNTLIVEDDVHLGRALVHALAGISDTIRLCGTVTQAKEEMSISIPQFILLDFQLPDGDGFMVLDHASKLKPTPQTIIMSCRASPEESFRLAQLGVRGYLPKPIDLADIRESINAIITSPVDMQPILKNVVGQRSIQEIQDQVRTTMVKEAFEKTGGNVRAMARMLKTSRQLIQYLLRHIS